LRVRVRVRERVSQRAVKESKSILGNRQRALTIMNSRFSKPLWHLLDARNQIVGRLATQIVHILRGKHKPTFSPNYDCGDYVVVINAQDIKFTGRKETGT
jgi:ribosomal protein L13